MGSRQHFRSVRFWVLVAVTAGVVAGCVWVGDHLMFTKTASLAHRVWLLETPRTDGAYRRDEYVVFEKRHPYMVARLEEDGEDTTRIFLTKAVKCLPGERLRTEPGQEIFPENEETAPRAGRHYYCNEVHLGFGWDHDSKGREMPRFEYDGAIPAGFVFVVGHHPRSFDSRYFGLLDVKEVRQRARPIL